MMNVIVNAVDIVKRFGNIVALDNVSIQIFGNEILGLLGENGSGKSTFAKILYGVYTPDKGILEIGGRRVFLSSPSDAKKLGIVMISQRPQLIDELTAVENMSLFLNISIDSTYRKALAISKDLGIDIDFRKPVYMLSYTEKQFVELIKSIMSKPRLLIVDETTTYLPRDVKEKFYRALKTISLSGAGVIFITHKIHEAIEVCDRIAVLRNGRLVGIFNKYNVNIDMLRKAMFGDRSFHVEKEEVRHIVSNKPVLVLDGVTIFDEHRLRAVDNITLDIYKGEIVSIVGIAGNGQKELCEGIVGFIPIARGRIIFDGIDISRKSVYERISMGIRYIPEDPLRDSVAADLTLYENIRMFLSCKIKHDDIIKYVKEVGIYPLEPKIKVYKLSGGNIQKVSLIRLYQNGIKLIIAHNPTRMLDEVSSAMVLRKFRELSNHGISILLVTEDIEEALSISDRIAVISKGRIRAIHSSRDVDLDRIEKEMTEYA